MLSEYSLHIFKVLFKDLHPNELGHELWTDEMLIPNIKRIINANTKHK